MEPILLYAGPVMPGPRSFWHPRSHIGIHMGERLNRVEDMR